MKYGTFEKKIKFELVKLLNEKGFHLNSNSKEWDFYKQDKNHIDYIYVSKGNQRMPNMNCIALSCARKLNTLESLIQEYKNNELGLGCSFTIQSTERNIFIETRKCFAPELENDVELAMEHIIYTLEKRFIPEMDRLSDIKVLNAIENKTVEHNGLVSADDMWLRKLALAWAAQDPIYEEIYKYVNDMDEKAIALNDVYKETYIKESIGFKQLYTKLNSLPKLENTLLI